jgi:hypothetical protein
MRVYFKEANSHKLSQREERASVVWGLVVGTVSVALALGQMIG